MKPENVPEEEERKEDDLAETALILATLAGWMAFGTNFFTFWITPDAPKEVWPPQTLFRMWLGRLCAAVAFCSFCVAGPVRLMFIATPCPDEVQCAALSAATSSFISVALLATGASYAALRPPPHAFLMRVSGAMFAAALVGWITFPAIQVPAYAQYFVWVSSYVFK